MYSASIAATWIWAPALFVSSSQSHENGIYGFLFFLIPNVLTLFLFAYFAEIVRKHDDGLTVEDAIKSADKRQKILHKIVSYIILICSTCVQFIGIHAIIGGERIYTAVGISILCLLMVGKDGIKGSIKTDTIKWAIMVVCGLFLFFVSDKKEFCLYGAKNPDLITIVKTFGITSIIGLMCAPYVDQTFWQRVYSIKPEKIKKTFYLSGLLFALVPLIFGCIGFFNGTEMWSLNTAFGKGINNLILLLCVLCALVSTLDSNLCAITTFTRSKKSMYLLLAAGGFLMVNTDLTITDLFLIYGTIRTCIAIPTILIILDRYDSKRLFYSTLIAAIITSIGFIITRSYWFSILGVLIPLLGYKSRKNESNDQKLN